MFWEVKNVFLIVCKNLYIECLVMSWGALVYNHWNQLIICWVYVYVCVKLVCFSGLECMCQSWPNKSKVSWFERHVMCVFVVGRVSVSWSSRDRSVFWGCVSDSITCCAALCWGFGNESLTSSLTSPAPASYKLCDSKQNRTANKSVGVLAYYNMKSY